MASMAAAGAVASIVGGAYSIYSGMQAKEQAKDAANEQKRLAAKNAGFKEAETREEARRMQASEDQRAAKARALAGASGVQQAGSMDIFMGSQVDEFSRQMDWLKQSGANQSSLIRKSGNSAADITRAQGNAAMGQGIAGGIGGISSGVSGLSASGALDDWWGGGAASPTYKPYTAGSTAGGKEWWGR